MLYAEGDVEFVKDFLDRAEVREDGREEKRDDRARDLDLKRRVAVHYCDDSVTKHVLLRIRRRLSLLLVAVKEILDRVDESLALFENEGDEIHKVVDSRIVFRNADNARCVKIERAVVQIDTAKDFVLAVDLLEVVTFVDGDEFESEFYLVEIAVKDRAVRSALVDESCEVDGREVEIDREFESDTAVELGHGLEFDEHIAKEVADERTEVVALRARRVEIQETGDAERDVLIRIGIEIRSRIDLCAFGEEFALHRTISIVHACACVRDVCVFVFIELIFAVVVLDKFYRKDLFAFLHRITASVAADVGAYVFVLHNRTEGLVLEDVVTVCVLGERIVEFVFRKVGFLFVYAVEHAVYGVEYVVDIFVKADKVESVAHRNEALGSLNTLKLESEVETEFDIDFVRLVFRAVRSVDVFLVRKSEQESQRPHVRRVSLGKRIVVKVDEDTALRIVKHARLKEDVVSHDEREQVVDKI